MIAFVAEIVQDELIVFGRSQEKKCPRNCKESMKSSAVIS